MGGKEGVVGDGGWVCGLGGGVIGLGKGRKGLQNVLPGTSHRSLPAINCVKKSSINPSLLPSTTFFSLSAIAFCFFSSCCSAVSMCG